MPVIISTSTVTADAVGGSPGRARPGGRVAPGGGSWRARTVLGQARVLLGDAHAQGLAADRFRLAHLAALRAAAALLLVTTAPGTRLVRRPTSAWILIDRFAPDFGPWAAYFAAHAAQRAAADAGAVGVVTVADAAEMLGAVRTFLVLVEAAVGSTGRPGMTPGRDDARVTETISVMCASPLTPPPRHLVLSEAG